MKGTWAKERVDMIRLCVGMAVHEDTEGALSTIQAIRMGLHAKDRRDHTNYLERVEFVIVNNSPDTPSGKALADFAGAIGATHVPIKEVVGTSVPRNKVFEHSTADFTICMDCHIQLSPDSIWKLMDFYDANPETDDLYTGPILDDVAVNKYGRGQDWSIMATHFNDVWRDRMWGIWGRAWTCGCGHLKFSTVEEDGRIQYIKLAMRKNGRHQLCPLDCVKCGQELPDLKVNGHEDKLKASGFKEWGQDENAPPLEIPGMGLGLFTCRTKSWLGFPDECRGFGAEEMNIHERYREAGRKCWCLPIIPWWHRFFRKETLYAPKVFDTVRNHFVWEMKRTVKRGMHEVHKAYVEAGFLAQADWDTLKADPMAQQEFIDPPPPPQMAHGGRPLPPMGANIEQVFEWCQTIPRDIEKHLVRLRKLASMVPHVTEFSTRRETTVAFLAALPPVLVSHNTEQDPLRGYLQHLHHTLQLPPSAGGPRVAKWGEGDSLTTEIEETDMLFLDTYGTGDRLYQELVKHAPKVRRWIVRHDTGIFGERGSDGEPGLAFAIKRFIEENPEWFIADHTGEQYGLTVLGRLEKDRPPSPITIWPKLDGVGTEFQILMAMFGVEMPQDCGCKARMRAMNQMGVKVCREKFDLLVTELVGMAEKYGWLGKLQESMQNGPAKPSPLMSIWRAIRGGAAGEIITAAGGVWKSLQAVDDPKKAIPVLLKVAIDRAEEKDDQ
jgi:hypothetical protein